MGRYLAILALVFVIGLSACSPTPPTKVPPTSAAQPGYPAEGQSSANSVPTSGMFYPVPEQNTPHPTPVTVVPTQVFNVPTPAQGKGVIVGKLVTAGTGGKPFIGDLYIAPLLESTQSGNPPMIQVLTMDQYKATEDAQGNFYIGNVEPGSYTLVIASYETTTFITDDKGGTLMIKVNPQEKKDLGTVQVK